MGTYKTEQEEFWAGEFGDNYIQRNNTDELIASNIALFSSIIKSTHDVKSIIEFGSNIGLNLHALKTINSRCQISAVEINKKAVQELEKIQDIRIYAQSILEFQVDYQRDFVFTKGVLIHLNPEVLDEVYTTLYNASKKYICIMEYYNPVAVQIHYRGFEGKLFKRDFAGEIMRKYPDLKLVDYGFCYHGDNNFPQDDITWFLLEK